MLPVACIAALLGVASFLTIDLASEHIAGAFRDALTALHGSF